MGYLDKAAAALRSFNALGTGSRNDPIQYAREGEVAFRQRTVRQVQERGCLYVCDGNSTVRLVSATIVDDENPLYLTTYNHSLGVVQCGTTELVLQESCLGNKHAIIPSECGYSQGAPNVLTAEQFRTVCEQYPNANSYGAVPVSECASGCEEPSAAPTTEAPTNATEAATNGTEPNTPSVQTLIPSPVGAAPAPNFHYLGLLAIGIVVVPGLVGAGLLVYQCYKRCVRDRQEEYDQHAFESSVAVSTLVQNDIVLVNKEDAWAAV